MKLCYAASSGGHLEEIARLKALSEGRECFLFTEKGADERHFCETVYYTDKISRRDALFVFKFIKLCYLSLRVLHRERPDCIITTGALCAYPVALFGKLLGCRLVYIESFARTGSASLTGKLLYPIADLFIVQWEEGLRFFPKAVYGGGIF